MLIQITSVELDFGGEELPARQQQKIIDSVNNAIYKVESEDDIADAISDNCGWLVSSFEYKELPGPGVQTEILWQSTGCPLSLVGAPFLCHTIGIRGRETDPAALNSIMRHTKAQVLSQFRYNWKVATLANPNLKGDDVAKRTEWNDFTDALCKEGYISENQYNNWSNPFWSAKTTLNSPLFLQWPSLNAIKNSTIFASNC